LFGLLLSEQANDKLGKSSDFCGGMFAGSRIPPCVVGSSPGEPNGPSLIILSEILKLLVSVESGVGFFVVRLSLVVDGGSTPFLCGLEDPRWRSTCRS
jgi:hypothetical protein